MMIRKPMRGNQSIFIPSLLQLEQIAALMANLVAAGDFVALTGTLGTGKTTFTRLLCEKLGVEEAITSPTFTLLNEYHGDHLTVFHGDFYRLTPEELAANLPELEAYLDESATQGLVLMEWADLAPDLDYRWTWHLDFAYDTSGGPEGRRLQIETQHANALTQLMEGFSHEP